MHRNPPRARTAPLSTLGFALLTLAGTLTAQSKPAPANGNGNGKPARPVAWPSTTDYQKEQIHLLAGKLVKAEGADADDIVKSIVAFGPGASTTLFARFSEDASANDKIAGVLDKLVTAEHAPLLVTYLGDKRAGLRHFVAARLAGFADKGQKPVFEKMIKDPDAEVSFQGTLALARLGDAGALEPLTRVAAKDWLKRGADIRKAAAALKGDAATKALVARLDQEDLNTRLGAMRMLSIVGSNDAAKALAPFLDSKEHILKKEAINALRGIVDNEPPLDTLSVFDAIDMAKKWKARVGG